MATLVRVLIQSPPRVAGKTTSASTRKATTAALRPMTPRATEAGRRSFLSTPLPGRPGQRDGAVASEVQQRDDRQHERRRRAVIRDRGVRRGDSLEEAHREAARA